MFAFRVAPPYIIFVPRPVPALTGFGAEGEHFAGVDFCPDYWAAL